MLDLRQLSALRAVAEQGSILRAAAALHWSQPTVSHHLRGLERLIGGPAVRSAADGTRLTPVGELLLPHATALLDRADRATAAARALLADARTRVALGIFPSAAARLLPGVVAALTAAGYEVDVTETELEHLLAMLAGLALDAAILYSAPERPTPLPDGSIRVPVRTERLSVIVPSGHRLAGRAGVAMAELGEEEWVLGRTTDDPVEAALVAAAHQSGFTPHGTARSDDYAVVAAYVAAGFGVALVPELALPTPMPGISVVGIADPLLERRIFLAASPTIPPAALSTITRAVGGGAAASAHSR